MRLTLPLLAAALALAVTGCAGEGAGPGPTAPHDQSAVPPGGLGASPSSAPSPTETGEPVDPEELTGRLEAAIAAAPTVHIGVEVQLDPQMSATAAGVQDLERNALDMDVDLGGQQIGYLLVDGQYYLAQPPKWVPVTKDSDNQLVEQTLQQIQILSLRHQLDAFVAGIEAAGVQGEEQLDGVTTTHYTASVDAQTALAEYGLEPAPGTGEAIVYDLWLDTDDLIRKMSFSVSGISAVVRASHWGEPVTIEKPEPDEIAAAPGSETP